MRLPLSHAASLVLTACLFAAVVDVAHAAVRVVTGPTPIVDGEARARGDITVSNQRLAFSLAVESPVPYGVPRGAIVDVAAVERGKIGRDRAVFADFIPNNWSAWPNTYQRVEIVERGPRRAVIRAMRDWGKVTLTTVYTLDDHSDRIDIVTTMHNGGATALTGLLSGLTMWPKGGFLFGVPGAQSSGAAPAPLARRVVAYDEDWTVALHAAYFNHIEYGSKDLYLAHSLQPGQSRRFAGALQVGAKGDLAPVIATEIARARLPTGGVRGTVRASDGRAVAQPVVVIEKQGKPYGWVLGKNGRYRVRLPAGEYSAYATAKGYRDSARRTIKLAAGGALALDFDGLQPPGTLRFALARDARIAIVKGQQPVVQFLGKRSFFTELDAPGKADVVLAPGDYTLRIGASDGFLFEAEERAVTVAPGAVQDVPVQLRRFADPAAQRWFAADLHHHADQAEAVTPPADVARAQLAAGLDLLFISDHDTMVNLAELERIAARRAVPALGSMEFSASWAHFNAYPLASGQQLAIDMSTAGIDAVLAEARRLGAHVIQVNHPFIPYGYFASVAAGVAPGGYNAGFDVAEINGATPGDDVKVLTRLWRDWNAGVPHYLAGGTDVHDVWNEHSGRVRTFVHVPGALTAASYAQALKAGHAYVSYGPLIYPDAVFGTRRTVRAQHDFTLGFTLQAMAGLERVDLIADGAVVESLALPDGPREKAVVFTHRAQKAGWVALVVQDRKGNKAYTNPLWIDLAP